MSKISSRVVIPQILRRFIELHQSINIKSEILERMREISKSAGGVSFSHTSCSSNKKHRNYHSKTESQTLKIIFLEESLNQDINELSKLTKKILSLLDKIEDMKCKELITYRYLCGNSWEQVAEHMNYSCMHVMSRLHPKALNLIENIENSK